MLNHIVMLQFKSDVTPEQITELEAMLEELPNRIVEILMYEFGRDVVRSERSFDFALTSLFANKESLQRYHQHPEHRKVLKKIQAMAQKVAVVDFEPAARSVKTPDSFDDLIRLQGRL